MYKIRLVCEGPTDYDALSAFLDAHLRGADYELTLLQPDGSLYGMGWLGLETLPPKVALWVPSLSTEAWILKALFPTDPQSVPCAGLPPGSTCVECLRDSASALLGRRPKLVQRKRQPPDQREVIRKLRREYQAQRSQLAGAWAHLVADLWSAARLDSQLREWIP